MLAALQLRVLVLEMRKPLRVLVLVLRSVEAVRVQLRSLRLASRAWLPARYRLRFCALKAWGLRSVVLQMQEQGQLRVLVLQVRGQLRVLVLVLRTVDVRVQL